VYIYTRFSGAMDPQI